MAKGSWRKKMKEARPSGSKNTLRGGTYPLLYVDKVYYREETEQGEGFFVEGVVLESRSLSQTEWAEKPGSEKMVTVKAQGPGERFSILFFPERFRAQQSGLKTMMGVLEGVDLFGLEDDAFDAEYDRIEAKWMDEAGENPFNGVIISVDAPMGYTKTNKVLMPFMTYARCDDEYQEAADELLKEVLGGKKDAA